MFPEDLEATLRKITNAARTGIEETGSNNLYIAFGFLEWYDANHSDQPRLAPLMLLPVSVERGRVDSDSDTYTYQVNYSDEDIAENLSLREKLDRNFGLVLPELDPDDLPNEPPPRATDPPLGDPIGL